MPTVLRIGPYAFFFYPYDRLNEPPHVHVLRDRSTAKVWLAPVRLAEAGGFARAEIRRIVRLVEENEDKRMEAWNGFDTEA